MTLQPSDLAPGAHVVGSYTAAFSGNPPTYEGTFEHVTTLGGVKLEAIQTFINLWPNDAAAAKAFQDAASYDESSYGHQLLFQGLYALTGVSHIALKTAHFGKFRSIGVGAQSLFVAVSFPAKPAAVAAGIVAVRVGRVVASVTTVAALGSPLADSVSLELARRTAGHISSELAAADSS